MTQDATPRVLFVSHTAELGGAELFMLDLVREGRAGWRAGFLQPGPAVDRLAAAGRPAEVIPAGASMLKVKRGSGPLALLRSVAAVAGTARRLAARLSGYDILCANSQKSLFVGTVASLIARRPLVWILHDIITDPAFSAATRRAAVVTANRFAARVVVNSVATAEAFVAAGGRRDLVTIVHNGFSAADRPLAAAERRAALRAELGLPDGPMVGLFGRLAPWKGQQVLIRALPHLPQASAVLVGAALFGEAAHEQELRDLAVRLGVADRVRFLGFRDDVPDLMAAVDVVAHTSLHPEPFGRVVVEGMLSGTPVVATAGGAIADIVDAGVTGWIVPPDDPDSLARAVRAVADDPAAAAAAGRRARAVAAERYGLHTTVAELSAVFAAVRPGPAPAPQLRSRSA